MASTSNETDALLGAQNPDGGNGSRQVAQKHMWRPHVAASFNHYIAGWRLDCCRNNLNNLYRPSSQLDCSSAYRHLSLSMELKNTGTSKYEATQLLASPSIRSGECWSCTSRQRSMTVRKVNPGAPLSAIGSCTISRKTCIVRRTVFVKVLHKLKNDVFTEEPKMIRNANLLRECYAAEFFWRGPLRVCFLKKKC